MSAARRDARNASGRRALSTRADSVSARADIGGEIRAKVVRANRMDDRQVYASAMARRVSRISALFRIGHVTNVANADHKKANRLI
jgi:hypothetical protein